jgi:hypothetical protein
MRVPLSRFYAWRPKVLDTIDEIRRGLLSRSTHLPVKASRLDRPRGGLFVIDGHHRVVEAILRGDRGMDVVIDPYLPYIERTGGGYQSVLDDMVNVRSFVRGR